jgi:hypothetical protein
VEAVVLAVLGLCLYVQVQEVLKALVLMCPVRQAARIYLLWVVVVLRAGS